MTLDFAKDALKKDNDKAYLDYCEKRELAAQGFPDFIKEAKEINNEIHFTKDELYWIERACDIETSMCMNKFLEICKLEHPEKLSANELNMLVKFSGELIDTYTMLKGLRIKLEMNRKNAN